MVILGHFRLIQPTFLIFSRNLRFPVERRYFSHTSFGQKFRSFVKIYFLVEFFQSVPHGKLKLSPVGKEQL